MFAITHEASSIKFFVKSSVALEGYFDKWDATLTFSSPEVSTGVLEIKIRADSVNTDGEATQRAARGLKEITEVKKESVFGPGFRLLRASLLFLAVPRSFHDRYLAGQLWK